MSYPKLVALDTDFTLVKAYINPNRVGNRRGGVLPKEDNLELQNEWKVRDRTNHLEVYWMYKDVPRIITDILSNGADLAIVSRNTSKAMCDRVLWFLKAVDPRTGEKRPIIDMVKYDEVYDEEKTVHMQRIKEWSGYEFSDMILYDDAARNNLVRVVQGVTFQVSRNQLGLTWTNYQEGLDTWRRAQAIRTPYLGQNPDSYPKRRLIGYSGMDEGTIALLTQGKNRVDLKESARWGYAMYITDNPAIAKFFANWIKGDAFGQQAKTSVCEIWVRDDDLFRSVNKIWVPQRNNLMTNVKSNNPAAIAWSQENRDAQVAKWGVHTPYILFSKHFVMNGMPVKSRWHEMVVYTQIQDALLLTIPLSDAELEDRMSGQQLDYVEQAKEWNIKFPQETLNEFRLNRDRQPNF